MESWSYHYINQLLNAKNPHDPYWAFPLFFHSIKSIRCHDNNVQAKRTRCPIVSRGNQYGNKIDFQLKTKSQKTMLSVPAFIKNTGLMMSDYMLDGGSMGFFTPDQPSPMSPSS